MTNIPPDPHSLAVHHVAFRTRDPARLAGFYVEALGLTVVRVVDDRARWLGLHGGVLMIERATEDEPAVVHGGMDLLAFQVDALGRDAVRARLARLGITVEAETDFTTYFRDPDGRRIAVSTYPL